MLHIPISHPDCLSRLLLLLLFLARRLAFLLLLPLLDHLSLSSFVALANRSWIVPFASWRTRGKEDGRIYTNGQRCQLLERFAFRCR